MNRCVLALPGAEAAAGRLATCLAALLGRIESRRFPDGETYLRVATSVAGSEAIVVAELRRPDARIPGLLFLADAARELGASRVGLVAAYLPYMRQDARFREGEALTSRSFARLVGTAFDWLITVDPHLHRYPTLDALYEIPCRVVAAAPAIADWVREHVVRPHLVGPDAESEQWVREVGALVGCPWTVLQKQRRGDRDVVLALPELAGMAGRTPVLIDDIVSSGSTLAAAAQRLCEAGLEAPVCIGVHAVLSAGATDRLAAAGVSRFVTCNTLRHASNAIDITPGLAQAVGALADVGTAAGPPGVA